MIAFLAARGSQRPEKDVEQYFTDSKSREHIEIFDLVNANLAPFGFAPISAPSWYVSPATFEEADTSSSAATAKPRLAIEDKLKLSSLARTTLNTLLEYVESHVDAAFRVILDNPSYQPQTSTPSQAAALQL
jgi:hypothetical protein